MKRIKINRTTTERVLGHELSFPEWEYLMRFQQWFIVDPERHSADANWVNEMMDAHFMLMA